MRFPYPLYIVHITKQFQTTFALGGVLEPLGEVAVKSKEENS